MKTLLVTDLDNTLYDWVTYFARSLRAMVPVAAGLLGISEGQLLDEFRDRNRLLGTVEQPFGLLELPSVAARLPGAGRGELRQYLAPAFDAFAASRERNLRLYPGVRSTLEELRQNGVTVVGHTESALENAHYRLRFLEIDSLFDRLYVVEAADVEHPDPQRAAELRPPASLVVVLPTAERKPNPRLLADICERQGSAPHEAIYVGDSLSRDVQMALDAGVMAVWARYGTEYQSEDWQQIVRVTHWTEADVERERLLSSRSAGNRPDRTLDSYTGLLQLFGLTTMAAGPAQIDA